MSSWTGDGWLNGAEWLPSPNFGLRPPGVEVGLAVIHNISLPPGGFTGRYVEDFFLNRLDAAVDPYFSTISDMQVSSHFYIRRDGHLVQFVSADDRAWHAGQSRWCGRDNCNDWSVGIELEGTDELPFEAAQYATLWRVLHALCQRYPLMALAGHSDIAPGRKTDPGACFAWAAVAERFPDLVLPDSAQSGAWRPR